MSPRPAIKIVIADAHPIFRTGVKAAFQHLSAGLSLIGEAATGTQVIELVKLTQPDVVLMDVEMPEMNGIEATRILKETFPLVRILAISYSNTSSAVLEMVGAGAEGYLLKDAEPEELAHAIKAVHTGTPYFSAATAIHLTTKIREEKAREFEGKKKALTRREKEILNRICEGESSKEIAASLYLSKRTIDTFREKIMKKAGVKNLLQLLRYAFKQRLIKD